MKMCHETLIEFGFFDIKTKDHIINYSKRARQI